MKIENATYNFLSKILVSYSYKWDLNYLFSFSEKSLRIIYLNSHYNVTKNSDTKTFMLIELQIIISYRKFVKKRLKYFLKY